MKKFWHFHTQKVKGQLQYEVIMLCKKKEKRKKFWMKYVNFKTYQSKYCRIWNEDQFCMFVLVSCADIIHDQLRAKLKVRRWGKCVKTYRNPVNVAPNGNYREEKWWSGRRVFSEKLCLMEASTEPANVSSQQFAEQRRPKSVYFRHQSYWWHVGMWHKELEKHRPNVS